MYFNMTTGGGTENRTLIDRLKAGYSTFELYPQKFVTLVTIHDNTPIKNKQYGTPYGLRSHLATLKGW